MMHLATSMIMSSLRLGASRAARPTRWILACSTLAVAGGCRVYARTPVADLAPGVVARVGLSEAEAVAAAPSIGPRGERLEGRVVSRTDSTTTLAVREIVRVGGVSEFWRGERVTLANTGISAATVPRVSRLRSGLVAAGILAAMVAAHQALTAGETVPGGKPPGSGAQQ